MKAGATDQLYSEVRRVKSRKAPVSQGKESARSGKLETRERSKGETRGARTGDRKGVVPPEKLHRPPQPTVPALARAPPALEQRACHGTDRGRECVQAIEIMFVPRFDGGRIEVQPRQHSRGQPYGMK